MTKTLVAAIAALFTVINVPASAQQENATRCPGGVCRPIPPPPPPPHPPPQPRPPQQVYPQPPPIYVYPQFVYPPFVGLCLADVGTCQVFRAPGSYCECKNWLGEVFSGIVQ